ncbi:hypothetical protein DP939_32335 [Spongiactinospora rosea]|uniref:Uncharacterized protein n=1 Tax=Spongiactinospora rosea TaxID=2248750 RepID=A0A366LQ36_9ACTN|nr:hypothetical protein [Spongiactinospora rosea]RBQ16006.1 hypothetical protein DP939_32335 [Spongiactinospora rosea]
MATLVSQVVVTEPMGAMSSDPIIVRLPAGPEDHVAALLGAWTGQGLAVSDRRSAMRFEAGDAPDALVYYMVLYGLTNRWVDVHVDGVPVDFQRIYEESRALPDAGRRAEHLMWAQAGGEDPPEGLPHAVLEPGGVPSPQAVSLIRYSARLRMVPPAPTGAAFACLARVAGIRHVGRERFPFLSTGREPEPVARNSPGQGIDVYEVVRVAARHRRSRESHEYEIVPAADPARYRRPAEANATPIEAVLTRLGSAATDDPVVWTCPEAGHDPTLPALLRIRRNRARCLSCHADSLPPAGLVARALDITPDEAAALILELDCVIDRPAPGYRRPELVTPPRPGTLVTAYVTGGRPDRFECVIYDAGIGHPREAVIWRPDTANLPPGVAGVELLPGDGVTALVTEFHQGTPGRAGSCRLSITEPELAVRALATQVPEVIDGAIVVKDVARKPGSRTKLAVAPTVPRLDAVGACLGAGENPYRLAAAHKLLNRHKIRRPAHTWEKLEIIMYSSDPRTYLMNAMRPAEVVDARIENGNAVVAVPPAQYRGGIGDGGLNAELAGKLIGLFVEVVPAGTDLDAHLGAFVRPRPF